MNEAQRQAEIKRLFGELNALEEKNGLTKAMENARADIWGGGPDMSPEEYFAEQHDTWRRRTRDVYFKVTDVEARKQLIEADRKIDETRRRFSRERVADVQKNVADLEVAALRMPWISPAIGVAGCVWLGHYLFAIPGAIAGAVIGFFLGQATVSNARAVAATEIAQAKIESEQEVKSNAEFQQRAMFFNLGEALTGERDPEFEWESATVAYWQRQREVERGTTA